MDKKDVFQYLVDQQFQNAMFYFSMLGIFMLGALYTVYYIRYCYLERIKFLGGKNPNELSYGDTEKYSNLTGTLALSSFILIILLLVCILFLFQGLDCIYNPELRAFKDLQELRIL